MLNFLYNTCLGRCLLRILCQPAISRICGKIMDSKVSLLLIPGFVKRNGIDLSEYISDDFKCFNEFFSRRIKPGLRDFAEGEDKLCAPCDGLLSIYKINDLTVLPVKQSHYSISDLLEDGELASEFYDGYCLVFRLCVNHFHRYAYFDSGKKRENVFIPGMLHTVRPVALRKYPVFVRNSREYTVLDTNHFKKAVQVEVGALLVGKIVNEHGIYEYKRGEEKGHFEYGGSTVIVLLKEESVHFLNEFEEIIDTGIEKNVKMGTMIGFGNNVIF